MATTTSDSDSSKSRPSVYLQNSEEVKKVFSRFDSNGDGRIDSSELASVLNALGSNSSQPEVDKMMDEMDSDRDGFVNIQEFADFCAKKVEGDESGVKELRDAFDMYDANKNGLISADELHQVLIRLGESCTVADCANMIQTVDSDGDGYVNFDEFKKMMSTAKKQDS